MDNFLTPVDINHAYAGGPLSTFEAPEDQLVQSGLLRAVEVPGSAPRCNTSRGDLFYVVRAFRLKDGRIRLTLSRSLVAVRLDASFGGFLCALVGGEVNHA